MPIEEILFEYGDALSVHSPTGFVIALEPGLPRKKGVKRCTHEKRALTKQCEYSLPSPQNMC
jgi:hypothetical protein